MQKILITILISWTLCSFRFGEPVAILTCKSVSGRTTFRAILPSCSYLEKAELSIDSSKLSFTSMDNGNIVFDPENNVLTVYLESKSTDPKAYKFLKFWAIPSTFKKVKSEKGFGTEFHDRYEFHAKLYGTEPRRITEKITKTIEVVCTLDYQL